MKYLFLFIICFFVTGCNSTSPPVTSDIVVVTAIPTDDLLPTMTPQEIKFSAAEACDVPASQQELPEYIPSTTSWVTIDNAKLVNDNVPFKIEGINYYPRMSPFDLFLTDSEADVVAKELEIITPSGINSLRIFIELDQLFLCETQSIPNQEAFIRLDAIIKTFIDNNFRLIVVLHQDISAFEPQSWEHLQFFIQRYKNEPAIIAWDVLDAGDKLYTVTSSEDVLTWLSTAIRTIQQVDSQHLVTASWISNAIDTAPLVDIVSFQHFGEYLLLRQEVANLKAATDKPIVLSAIGYSTFDVDETAQRNLLFQAIEEVRNNDLSGWVIYNAFDYPTSVTCIEPDCPAKPASLNFYGIWNTSYFPKLAVDAIKRVTESD